MPIIGGIYTCSNFVYIVLNYALVYRVSTNKINYDCSQHIDLTHDNIVRYLTEKQQFMKISSFYKYNTKSETIFEEGYLGQVPKTLRKNMIEIYTKIQDINLQEAIRKLNI